MTHSRHIPLPGIYNLRDLGGYPTVDGTTVWRRALRADSLHRLDRSSMEQLRDFGCTTVIDLRNDDETDAQKNPFSKGLTGVAYHNISLLAALDPTGPGIQQADNLLLALYCQALNECADHFVQVMRILARAEGTVLFHCTAGKDRTGMIAAFLLLLARTPRSEIVADYALTKQYAPQMFAALRTEIEAAGKEFDPASPLLLSDAETMEAFLDYLETAHGGVESYLLKHGLTQAEITEVRARMLQAAPVEGIS